MQLKSIKLAGFKSFVDPTTVSFPSNLVGVVGPNGCGKSNVIDAVRWVMGETSARQLRGDSMADVIFNGSNGRKPVGQASIELVFDNSSGRIAGEYAGYNEISIRRRVTRDGQSDYFLNGNKCRRRDITDIFLGTGLGPRSYSIIEQGMISNLITARPEDLRVYVEEAAGISKYKERRRDTENRMHRTRENLERLTDFREELGRQLHRLQRQSQAAKRYREYKQEEQVLNEQLLSIRWRYLHAQFSSQQESIRDSEVEVEKLVAAELSCATEIEKQRSISSDKTDALNLVQSKYYELGAEIARLEQIIKHEEERRQQLAEDLSQTEGSYRETGRLLEADRAKASGWEAELHELAQQKQSADTELQAVAKQLEQHEREIQDAQSDWEAFQAVAAENRQRAELQQSSIQHYEQSMQTIIQRRERIRSQPGDDDSMQAIAEQADTLRQRKQELEDRLENAAGQEVSQDQEIIRHRETLNNLSSELDATRSRLQEKRGRLSSLETLQEVAMRDVHGEVEEWLKANELDQAPRVADSLVVESGWELAVERALGGSLRAIQVADIESTARDADSLGNGAIDFIDASDPEKDDVPANRLSSKVAQGVVSRQLDRIWVAEDLNEALRLRSKLDEGESAITSDGTWIGTNWCSIVRGDLVGGMLERKSEIENLNTEISDLEGRECAQKNTILAQQADLRALEEQLAESRRNREHLAGDLSILGSELAALTARYEQLLAQIEHRRAELTNADEQYAREEALLSQARAALTEALDSMEQDKARRGQLTQARSAADQNVSQSRTRHQQAAQSAQQFAMREQMVSTQLLSLRETIERMEIQMQRLAERRKNLESGQGQENQPDAGLKQQMETKLHQRLDIEQQLTQAREELESVDQAIRTLEEKRQACASQLLDMREHVQNQRIQTQDVLTRKTTLEEQLGEINPETVLSDLPEDVSESQWVEQLTALHSRISRLGPINLAAIDEYQTESERKAYLDEQNAELVEALETLETAIRKIDRETRTRFKETFDKIDNGFKSLFPKLFGGGHAYLELTGDDLLETGVTIMARPPGKRVSTIQLLSGGEKAMTAIALVFAIFQLNPAPFCMLDEVDAPLDDTNVSRFANMVNEMSAKVQFILITHNKITMEIADQLMGVTMHEPGVSRLVTVDVESAIKMAAV